MSGIWDLTERFWIPFILHSSLKFSLVRGCTRVSESGKNDFSLEDCIARCGKGQTLQRRSLACLPLRFFPFEIASQSHVRYTIQFSIVI